MVPYCKTHLLSCLESIAATAATSIGVILLSNDPEASSSFVESQPHPDRFTIVAASYDTPWIRDRAPIAAYESGMVRWILPRLPAGNRALDDRLFASISARETVTAPLIAAQGNIVAGPNGLALSTDRLLHENGLSSAAELSAHGPVFGIRRWLVFESFPDEPSRHADVHVRFLKPDLMAVAWHRSERRIQSIARAIEERVRAEIPDIRIVRIPITRERDKYASLVNWIQVGHDLFLPAYELTPDSDIKAVSGKLKKLGFRTKKIASPTIDLGGSLHCLTASIYV